MASKFKPGDVVIKTDKTAYHSLPASSQYNVPDYPLEVRDAGGSFITLYAKGKVTPPLNPECFELCTYEPKLLKRGTVWINIYENGQGATHSSKEKAHRMASSYRDRIACVEVPWVEGQGLE